MPASLWRRRASFIALWPLLFVVSILLASQNLRVTLWQTSGFQQEARQSETDMTYLLLHGDYGAMNVKSSFPRWGDEGIWLQPMLDFILGIQNRTASTVANPKTRRRFPESLYVVDSKGVWVSDIIRQRTLPGMLKARVRPMELLFHDAWMRLRKSENAPQNWPRLYEATLDNAHGFPFLAWFGDYKSCNDRNWKDEHSIPLFTVCASVTCNYTFPIPSYTLANAAKDTGGDWDAVFRNYSILYPFEKKLRQVVWRGSLSAPNDNLTSVRWRVCELAARAATNLLDVGLTDIPSRHDHLHLNLSIVGGLKRPILPMHAFQKYIGILDMDGNSWSSRFVDLMCYNSAVLKVEPEYIDYFYQRDLQPWTHYVPVKDDLSDLMDAAQFVTNISNTHAVQAIIVNANRWCRKQVIKSALQEDMLDIWESYLKLLSGAGSVWPDMWKDAKSSIFQDNFDMRLLPR